MGGCKMKDPAVLLYIDKWLVSTKGMRGNAKGWYLNLILYQYDRGELPNDIEELANLCDVRISEFEEFKQVFEQVLKHKFIVNDNGCLQNEFANEILKKRETFKEKRSDSGRLGYVIKYFRNNFKYDDGFENYFKENVNIDFDIKDEQLLKQVFKQNYKLYININKDINKDSITIDEIKENNNKEEIKKEDEIPIDEIPIDEKQFNYLEYHTYYDLVEHAKKEESWFNSLLLLLKLEKETILSELENFPIVQEAKGNKITNLKDFKNHFFNYMNLRKDDLRKVERKKSEISIVDRLEIERQKYFEILKKEQNGISKSTAV